MSSFSFHMSINQTVYVNTWDFAAVAVDIEEQIASVTFVSSFSCK